jgi:hypothetical protein
MFLKDGFYELWFEVENVSLVLTDAIMLEANGNGGEHNDGNGNVGDAGEGDTEDQRGPR